MGGTMRGEAAEVNGRRDGTLRRSIVGAFAMQALLIASVVCGAPHHCSGGGGPLSPEELALVLGGQSEAELEASEPPAGDHLLDRERRRAESYRKLSPHEIVGIGNLRSHRVRFLLEYDERLKGETLCDEGAEMVGLFYEFGTDFRSQSMAISFAAERLETTPMSADARERMMDVVYRGLADERDARIRLTAVTWIGRHSPVFLEETPVVLGLIDAASNDPDDRVRQRADEVLRTWYGF